MYKTRKMASSLPNPEKRGLNKIAEIRSLSAWCIFPPTNPICEKGGAWGGALFYFFCCVSYFAHTCTGNKSTWNGLVRLSGWWRIVVWGGWAGGLGDGFSLLAVLPEFAAHERVLGRPGGRESRTYAWRCVPISRNTIPQRERERERERRNLKSTKSGMVVSGSITPRKS